MPSPIGTSGKKTPNWQEKCANTLTAVGAVGISCVFLKALKNNLEKPSSGMDDMGEIIIFVAIGLLGQILEGRSTESSSSPKKLKPSFTATPLLPPSPSLPLTPSISNAGSSQIERTSACFDSLGLSKNSIVTDFSALLPRWQ